MTLILERRYVVMPEHFHLLLSEPQRASLSTVMQALKLGFVRPVSAPRPVWQPRFYDFNVWTEHKRLRNCGICTATR